jgi:predicted peroxiredoxin
MDKYLTWHSDAQTMTFEKRTEEVHLVLASNDPARVYPAFSIALGAVAMGGKASVYCTMGGLDAVKKEESGKILYPGMPPVSKFVSDVIGMGGYICACAPTKEMLDSIGVNRENLLPGVLIEDVFGFLERAFRAAKQGGLVLFV